MSPEVLQKRLRQAIEIELSERDAATLLRLDPSYGEFVDAIHRANKERVDPGESTVERIKRAQATLLDDFDRMQIRKGVRRDQAPAR